MKEEKRMTKNDIRITRALLKSIEIHAEHAKTPEEVKKIVQEIAKELTDPSQGNR